jgi:hypothetical protein
MSNADRAAMESSHTPFLIRGIFLLVSFVATRIQGGGAGSLSSAPCVKGKNLVQSQMRVKFDRTTVGIHY